MATSGASISTTGDAVASFATFDVYLCHNGGNIAGGEPRVVDQEQGQHQSVPRSRRPRCLEETNFALPSSSSSSASPDTCDDEWARFLLLVDSLARLCDPVAVAPHTETGAPHSTPRLGDLVYAVTNLYSCGGRSPCDGSPQPTIFTDAANPTRDLLLLGARQFTDRYLTELAQRCDPDQRARVLRVKSWLTCRVHFDRQLLAALDPTIALRRSAASGNGNARERRLVERCIVSATNHRVSFCDVADNSDQSRAERSAIETFSPTFALFTVCNLRDEYVAMAFASPDRFDYAGTSGGRGASTASTTIGRPPSVSDALSLYTAAGERGTTSGGSSIIADTNGHSTGRQWPEQQFLVNVRSLVSRDRTLQRFIELACGGSSATPASRNVAASASGRHSSSPPLSVSSSSHVAAPTIDAIKVFDRPDLYESKFQTARPNISGCYDHGTGCSPSDRTTAELLYDRYLRLVDALALAWAKLHFLQPRIFE